MKLLSSKSSSDTHPEVEIGDRDHNRARIRIKPLVSYLTNKQFLDIFEAFLRAVQKGETTRPHTLNDGRLIISVSSYSSTTCQGGIIRLSLDGVTVEISPTDFLAMLLDYLPTGNAAYGKVMDVLTHHAHGGSGTLEERATACLKSLAGERKN